MMDCACSMGSGSMMWMMLLPAIILGGVIIGGILLARRFWPNGSAAGPGTALRILQERYARGEIDREEFDERREHLRL